MRMVACWFLVFFLCGPLLSEEIVVASYNVENYLPVDRQKDGVLIRNAPKPCGP
jgi:hypothetical protein